MKKLFKSKFTKEKAAKFFDREGFYIVLFICVCIVAVTAVWVSRGGLKKDPSKNLGEVKGNNTVVNTPTPQVKENTPVKEASAKKDTSAKKDDNKLSSTKETKTSKTENKATDNSKAAPVTAAPKANASASVFNIESPVKSALAEDVILRDYSPDQMVFYPYLNEWKNHMGLDVKSPEGAEVMSVGNGKVIDVRNDNDFTGGLGWTVVVDHNNGYRSVYCNLAENLAVQKNQTVKKGQKLGVVGNTSIFEKDIPEASSIEEQGMSHLHFELLKKKTANTYENVNPKEHFLMDDN